MDETIIEKAILGGLEEEGAENVFMTEVGWATYLDKEAGQSYNMNERVSKAKDGYFTPDFFSNPIDVASSWVASSPTCPRRRSRSSSSTRWATRPSQRRRRPSS